MKTIRTVSRRHFVAFASLAATGCWTGISNHFVARSIRGFIAESSRSIKRAAEIPKPHDWNPNRITATWLGHSTVLVNFYGCNILTDPVLFGRVGVDVGLATVGPKRLVASALSARQLPRIDLVLLSHADFDHLDRPSLKCFSAATQVVTARDTEDLLRGTRLNKVNALAWGERTLVQTGSGDVEVEAIEVKHWGARIRRDTYRGYNGYVLRREGKSVLFGGDTAMSESFRALHSKGPFDLAIMPIGSYRPWIRSHCTPEQALKMANAAGANYFLPIHYKTFALGVEGPTEPIERLEASVEKERLGWRDIGQTFSLG